MGRLDRNVLRSVSFIAASKELYPEKVFCIISEFTKLGVCVFLTLHVLSSFLSLKLGSRYLRGRILILNSFRFDGGFGVFFFVWFGFFVVFVFLAGLSSPKKGLLT